MQLAIWRWALALACWASDLSMTAVGYRAARQPCMGSNSVGHQHVKSSAVSSCCSTASIGPPPLAVMREVRKADRMMQGPLPLLELVKSAGSDDTTVRPLAGTSEKFAAGAHKFVCT
jgi:hypothetical protein